jgi:hypothetical protein
MGIYHDTVNTSAPNDVMIAETLDEAAMSALQNGKKAALSDQAQE